MATKILITDGMAKDGVEILKAVPGFEVVVRDSTPKEELEKIIGDYDCIVIRSATTLTADLIEKAKSMKLIVRAGAGVDNIEVPVATEKKIPVMNTASANSLAAAEQTIALLFAMFRQVPQAAQSLREGRWDRTKFKGFEVTGKHIGVLGLGNIGRIVADKAIGLGMTVYGYDPQISSKDELSAILGSKGESFHLCQTVDEVLPQVDIVTLHIPKTKETAGLMNAERIAKMKNGSFLMNCARGGLVEEKAVLDALEKGKLAGAAFDVFDKEPPEFPNPLFQNDKVVCAPHLGASTFEAQHRVALTAAKQITGFFNKGDRHGVINGL